MTNQEAADWLRSQPYDAMPSIGTFMRECEISLQDAVDIISQHTDLNTRIVRVPDDSETQEKPPKLTEVFNKCTPNDLQDAYRYSFMSQVMPALVMAYKLMEAAGETAMTVSAPVDLGTVDICDWPNPYATLSVRKVNNTVKFNLDGEWRL